jgi:hypothetical protein
MDLFKLKYYLDIMTICIFITCLFMIPVRSFQQEYMLCAINSLNAGICLYQIMFHNDVIWELIDKWKKS